MRKSPKKPLQKKLARRESRQDKAFRNLATSYYKPQSNREADVLMTEEELEGSHTWRYILVALLLTILIPLITIAIWDVMNFSSASKKLFGSSSVLGLFPPSALEDDDGRVNILLVGYSKDDPGHAGALLTDSILLMSLHKSDTTKSYMLSIPRDLYVDIPNYGFAKINEAYIAGQTQKFRETGQAKGGMGLLRKIVGENLGVDIHYHALINYGAVRDIVDALDGVSVNIKSTDKRGIYDPNFQPHEGGPLKLKNGVHEVDGITALKLTRARGATYGSYGFPQSDFNRTQNQQKVVSAIMDELSWTLVLDPRTNGKIFSAAANNVKTDIKLNEVISLYRLLNDTPTKSLKSYTLRELNGKNYLISYTTPGGLSALIPARGISDFSEIQIAIEEL